MANIGALIGIDPAVDKVWKQSAKAHKLMMPRLLGVNAAKVVSRGLLHVHPDGTVHPLPENRAEITSGTILAVSAINDLHHETRWWRFRGFQTEAESTSGRSFLFGYTHDGKVVDCPISLEWVLKFVDFGPKTAEKGAVNGVQTAL